MDDIDRKILAELVADGRISFQDLGRRVGLSPTATSDRVRKLQRDGIITGYRAVLDPVRFGRTVEASIDVRLEPNCDRERFGRVLREHGTVFEATHVTGAYDYVLWVRCTGSEQLDDLLSVLKTEAGVVETQTRLLLHRVPGLGDQGLLG